MKLAWLFLLEEYGGTKYEKEETMLAAMLLSIAFASVADRQAAAEKGEDVPIDVAQDIFRGNR